MRNPTHAAAGAVAALGLGALAAVPTGWPEALAGANSGLLPNADYGLDALRKCPVPALQRFAERNTEGGITHSLPALAVAALLGLAVWGATGRPGMLPAVFAGVLSHILLDMFGKTGVQLWIPFSRSWIAFPPWERLRPPRGEIVEIAVFTSCTAVLAGLGVMELFPYVEDLMGLLMAGGAR